MGKATSGNAKGDSGPQENHISKSHVENSTPSAGWRWLPIDYFGCLIDKRQLQTAESQGDVDFPGVEKGVDVPPCFLDTAKVNGRLHLESFSVQPKAHAFHCAFERRRVLK